MERKGVIYDSKGEINYSFHGAGMNLECNNRIISFDFNEVGRITYDSFQFLNFLSSANNETIDEEKVQVLLNELIKESVLQDINAGGLYLKRTS